MGSYGVLLTLGILWFLPGLRVFSYPSKVVHLLGLPEPQKFGESNTPTASVASIDP